MKRDWNSGSQKKDFRFKGADLSPRTQKSSTDNSNNSDNKVDPQHTKVKSKKLFSEISKPNEDSLIRNKNSNVDNSDIDSERTSQKNEILKPAIRHNSKGNDVQDENIRTTKTDQTKRSSKNHDGLNARSEKKKSQRRNRKKYSYASNHENIKLSIEVLFELERPRIEPLSSSARRKKNENIMEMKLPGNHLPNQREKNLPKKQIKENDNSSNKYNSKENPETQLNHKTYTDDYMYVGTGDDLKIILNISKYYTDLGEKVASEVINKSLVQVKHHDIILPEDEQKNKTNQQHSTFDTNHLNEYNIPSLSSFSQPKSQDNEQENHTDQLYLFTKDQEFDNFMLIGSGNNLKVVFNISKYYTDLGEKLATEVINNSLSQIKHHGILSNEEKEFNNNNYTFNYSNADNNDELKSNQQESQRFPSLNQYENKDTQQFPKTDNPQTEFSFPSVSKKNQINTQHDEQKTQNENLFPKEQKSEDYMYVGSGDDLKIVLNISKYYTDLGEKVATEVIKSSLIQVKHHDIILPEDEPENKKSETNRQNQSDETSSLPKEDDQQDTQNDYLHLIAKEHENDNFMVVGSGNNLKVVFNIGKYYTELGEMVANQVINNSLSQIKHHGILSTKEQEFNNNNYIFNYLDSRDDDKNKPSDNQKDITKAFSERPKPPVIRSHSKSSHETKNENDTKTSSPSSFNNKEKPSDAIPQSRVKNPTKIMKNNDSIPQKRSHNNSNSEDHNNMRMVPVSEEDILPLDEDITSSNTQPKSKSTKTIKNNSNTNVNNDLSKVDDSLTISESNVKAISKNRIKRSSTANSTNNLSLDNDAFMSSDFVNNDAEKGEKKKSKIVVIRSSSGQQKRRSSTLESVSESDNQSNQPTYKKRPLNLRNTLLASHSQVADSFENLNGHGTPVNIRKAKSSNIIPVSSPFAPNNDDQQQQQRLPPVQQSPRSLKNISSKSTSSSQPLNIAKEPKNAPTSLVQQRKSLNTASDDSNNIFGVSKKSSADIPLTKLPKDLNDSSSVERSKRKRNVLIKTSANSSTSALPISPQPTPSPFNEVTRSSHK